MGYTYCTCAGSSTGFHQGCYICKPNDWVKIGYQNTLGQHIIMYEHKPLEYRFTLPKILPEELFEI